MDNSDAVSVTMKLSFLHSPCRLKHSVEGHRVVHAAQYAVSAASSAEVGGDEGELEELVHGHLIVVAELLLGRALVPEATIVGRECFPLRGPSSVIY